MLRKIIEWLKKSKKRFVICFMAGVLLIGAIIGSWESNIFNRITCLF